MTSEPHLSNAETEAAEQLMIASTGERSWLLFDLAVKDAAVKLGQLGSAFSLEDLVQAMLSRYARMDGVTYDLPETE